MADPNNNLLLENAQTGERMRIAIVSNGGSVVTLYAWRGPATREDPLETIIDGNEPHWDLHFLSDCLASIRSRPTILFTYNETNVE
jgi:hypothetical protein